MANIYDFKNYKKEKCSICGEMHICIDIFNNSVCNYCYKELGKYRNMVNNIYRQEYRKVKGE